MIYELHTYDLKVGTLAKYEARFAEAYEKRRKYSEMAAFWHTEFGLLNQVVHLWSYADHAERARVHDAVGKDAVWPADLAPRFDMTSTASAPVTLWKGFKRRFATGLELRAAPASP